ncbi:hypothetical protein ACS0TY_016298 [Phlomoides rotata]
MEDQYGIADLRQFVNGKPYYTTVSQPPDLLSCHRGVTSPYPYDMLMFRSDHSAVIAPTAPNINLGASSNNISAAGSGFQMEFGGGDAAARWPRQETLSLLEIRSRLDSKFKEANQKSPLWDEVSRIMSEEYGYQRSGKKCREKFENLYKYYKKTKDGKGGRQDGKHYRFFKQLEALYGDQPSNSNNAASNFPYNSCFPSSNPINNAELYNPDTSMISLPNSSEYDTVSSDCSDSNAENKKRRTLKAKIRESIDEQMKKLMEKQETWMQKMITVMEQKEQERIVREEHWRKQDAARIDREQKLWASERAWIEGRDVALMEAFQRLAGDRDTWQDSECVSNYLLKCSKKRKENSDQGVDRTVRVDDCESGGPVNESCFRYFMGDSYGRL